MDERTESGLVLFEYAVRAKAGDDPFILNNHRAQLRTNHQRIVHGPNGGLMHVSGVEVLDVEDFEKDSRFYRWQDKDRSGRWRDDTGRVLAPFLFPTAPWAGGKDEELDPQWVRETFTLDLATQREECVKRYLDRAAAKGWEGDKRGTTLNLQVGASADDSNEITDGSGNITNAFGTTDSVPEWLGWRWQSVTVPQGATINTCVIQICPSASTLDEPLHDFDFQDADAPAEFVTGGAGTNDISGRTRTGNEVLWNSADLGADGATFFSTPSLVTPFQAVVNRGGFAGSSVVATCHQPSLDGARDFSSVFYDGNSALAAKLDIDYTAGGATGKPYYAYAQQ